MKLFTTLRIKAFAYTIALLFPALAFCQTNTWNPAGAGGNNWSNTNKWTLGIPTATHDVVINSTVSISVDVNPGTINSLTISGAILVTLVSNGAARTITIDDNGSSITASGTLLLQGSNGVGTRTMGIAYAAGGTRTMNISGRLILNDVQAGSIYSATNSLTTVASTGILQTQTNNGTTTITSTTANLSFLAGGTYNHARNGGAIPVATWASTSNCNITGITNVGFGGLNQSFGNLTWDCAGQTANFNLIELLTDVQGNLTLSRTNGRYISFTSTTNAIYNLNIRGDLNVNLNNSVFFISAGDNITADINVSGNFNMTGGTGAFVLHPVTGAGVTLNKIRLNVTGNYTQTGGLFDFATGDTDAPSFTELNLGGNFSLTATGVIRTFTNNNLVINGTITFNKSGTQTVQVDNPGNIIYTNFIIANNSNVQLLSNIELTSEPALPIWGGKFTVNSGGILDAGTNQILSSTGAAAGTNNSFTLNSGAGLITANVNGVQNANIGTVSTSLATRTYNSGANFTYNNSTVIQNSGIFTTTTPNLINNLTINNTAGPGTTGVTLQQPIAVAGVLTLISGHITTDATNLLIMNAGSSVNTQVYTTRISGGSANSFINGPMRKIGGTDFLFPVGKLTRGTRYCGISGTTIATDAFTAEFISGSASNKPGGIIASGLYNVSKCEYWTIDRTAGSSSTNVTLSWNPASICNAAAYVTQLSSLVVAHYGTSWDNFGNNGGNTGNVSSGSVTWNNVSTFSPFSLGSTSPSENPLPVKLVDVKAYNTGNKNRIEWTNLTEIDVVAYEIEKSLNGTQFTSMVSLVARSNENDKQSYYEYDAQPSFVTYYRIKVTSRDAKIIYSPIVKVATNLTVKQDIVLYPNPVTGKQFTIQMNSAAGNYFVKIYTANGQIVKTETLTHPGGSYSKTIELPSQLQAGQYYMQVSGGEKILTSKFIVQ